MSAEKLRDLKIKTGILKRVSKEKISYRKEADQQKAKLEKMKAEGKDEHDIKKMGEVIQETLMMIPDCHRRIVAAQATLKGIVDAETDLAETEEYQAAKQQLEEAEVALKME